MKLLFEAEDSIIGIIVGGLLIAMSERYFTIPYVKWYLLAAIIISIIFSFLDVFHSFVEPGSNLGLMIFLFINNAVDIIIEAAFIVKIIGFNVPFLSTTIAPYLDNLTVVFWLGIFFIASSLFWFIFWPFAE